MQAVKLTCSLGGVVGTKPKDSVVIEGVPVIKKCQNKIPNDGGSNSFYILE